MASEFNIYLVDKTDIHNGGTDINIENAESILTIRRPYNLKKVENKVAKLPLDDINEFDLNMLNTKVFRHFMYKLREQTIKKEYLLFEKLLRNIPTEKSIVFDYTG